MLSMLIQQNPLVLVTFVQVNLFLERTFTQVNLFVKVIFVKVKTLLLKSFHVNLFVLIGDISHVNLPLLNQQLFLILIFSVYYKFIITAMNIFTNLFLAMVILLSKLTCLRAFFTLHISHGIVSFYALV